jgi:thioredoxin 1
MLKKPIVLIAYLLMVVSSCSSNNPTPAESPRLVNEGMSFDDYLAHIKSSDKLVLVDFNAVWCGPCRMLKPRVEKQIKMNSDKVELFEVDCDKNPQVAAAMNIKNIPLLILYKQGKEVWRSLGLISENEIAEQLKQFGH